MNINADLITKFCFDFFKKNIPNNIKPSLSEWTTLAAIVLIDNKNDLKGRFFEKFSKI